MKIYKPIKQRKSIRNYWYTLIHIKNGGELYSSNKWNEIENERTFIEVLFCRGVRLCGTNARKP